MRDSQVSTVPVPSESLLDDMEQLLRSQLEEFDLAAEDSGGSPMMTESVDWSLQVKTPSVFLKWWLMFFHPILPQLRAVFASMDVVAIFR